MSESNAPASLSGDREIVISRVFDAPRDMVFDAWTDPRHLENWWGPNGFTLTTHSMSVRPGGVWDLTMHGPDGKDYKNMITFLEVSRPSKLVYKHGGPKDYEPANFQVTVTFEELAGKTRLDMRMTFPSAAARDFIVKTYGAVDGLTQTVGRLSGYLKNFTKELVIEREFDAPRELVFDAWTQREHLMNWFGPKGFTMIAGTIDLRPGGTFHYGMKTPDGKEMWGKWTFIDILRPELLVTITSFSDAQGNVTRHPFAPGWPLQTISRTTFEERNGKTLLTLRWSAYNATKAERDLFDSSHESMQKGFAGTFEQLTKYLATL